MTTHCIKYHYAECHILFFVIMLSVIMLIAIMLSVIMLNVVMLSVVILNVVKLSVVAPFKCQFKFSFPCTHIKKLCWLFKGIVC